jgi:hypothetical protein
MAADPLRDLSARLDGLAKDLGGDAMRKVMTDVGVEGKKSIDAAVRTDLGDTSFSNWRRGRPIQIGGRFDLKSDTSLEMLPARRAAGPMRVLTDGRAAGISKGRKRQGRVGSTRGRGTWTEAEREIEQELPKQALDAIERLVRKALS